MVVHLSVVMCKISSLRKTFSGNLIRKLRLGQEDFFERTIKSVKRCLKKVLLNARLDYEELLTVLKEIGSIVNNRPLIYLYDDVNQDIHRKG